MCFPPISHIGALAVLQMDILEPINTAVVVGADVPIRR
jgi:hypothetical protein